MLKEDTLKMPIINPKHSYTETAVLVFLFSYFYSLSLSSMAGLNTSLPYTNLCAGTIVYGLKQCLGAEDSIGVENNLVPKNKLYF